MVTSVDSTVRDRTPHKDEIVCLTFCPFVYVGKGPGNICVQVLRGLKAAGLRPILYLPRAYVPLPGDIEAVQTLGWLRKVPPRWSKRFESRSLFRAFRKALDRADPERTIAYFWPDVPEELVEHARRAGIVCVREMINCAQQLSRRVLAAPYARLGLTADSRITPEQVDRENAELLLYDRISAPNAEVERSLAEIGIKRDVVMPSSFGWSRDERFAPDVRKDRRPGPIRFGFVGSIDVRKGAPDLLEAWEKANIDGELLFAGRIDPQIETIVERHLGRNGVRHVGFVNDVRSFFAELDVFIFPTWEEGGPLVTYEAAVSGVPIITTPMGAARLVEHECTGLIVAAGGVDGIAAAMLHFADDAGARERMRNEALKRVLAFEYMTVGKGRATQLVSALREHQAADRG